MFRPNTSLCLIDHCKEVNLPEPEWRHEFSGYTSWGERKYKVWVVIGKTKYELPMTFTNLHQGQEKVARKVVGQVYKKVAKQLSGSERKI